MTRSVSNGIVYVIDVGQSVNTTHNTWRQLLRRDVDNILNFYNHHGAIADLEEVQERTYAYVLAEETETVTNEYDSYLGQHILWIVCLINGGLMSFWRTAIAIM